MSLSIHGKTAIVTGAGRGIGLAIARHFEEAGANVMFADSDEATLEAELGEQMTGEGPVRGFAGDLGQKLTLANLVSATMDAFDRIDILVNAHRMVQGCDPLAVSAGRDSPAQRPAAGPRSWAGHPRASSAGSRRRRSPTAVDDTGRRA